MLLQVSSECWGYECIMFFFFIFVGISDFSIIGTYNFYDGYSYDG